MNWQDQNSVGVQRERAIVQLRFGIKVVIVTFPLQPSEQAPFAGSLSALHAASHGIGYFARFKNVVVRFRPVEGKWRKLLVGVPPSAKCRRLLISLQLLPRIDYGFIREPIGIDVIAAAAKVVIRVPGVRAGQHRDLRLRLGGSHHPRE